MTEWGKPIEVNGKRPAWLGDDEIITVKWGSSHKWSILTDGDMSARDFAHTPWDAIRLPSDHWAYKALDLGFEPWGGGSSAPDDWDGGQVLLRDSTTWNYHATWGDCGTRTIIGYRKKGNTMTNTPADWAIERALSTFSHRGWTAEEVMRRADETGSPNIIAAFARYIEQHEEAPVDPDLAIAREAVARAFEALGLHYTAGHARDGGYDTNDDMAVPTALAAIKLARERGKL